MDGCTVISIEDRLRFAREAMVPGVSPRHAREAIGGFLAVIGHPDWVIDADFFILIAAIALAAARALDAAERAA
jgi:hypothetical protein